jgi:CBS domain-containing protein
MALSEALAIMEEKEIWDLPVVTERRMLVGLLHLHPAIKAAMGL